MAIEFGTDGVREVMGRGPMTLEGAEQLGRATVAALELQGQNIMIGGDTRDSTSDLRLAFADGVAAMGGSAVMLGKLPTPGIAYSVMTGAEAGVSITASHNPYSRTDPGERWNGYKLFGADGGKLGDKQTAEVVRAFDRRLVNNGAYGHIVSHVREDFINSYLNHLAAAVGGRQIFAGQRIGIDTAHGAANSLAGRLMTRLGAQEVVQIGNRPDGFNINDGVGATHPEAISELVERRRLAFGGTFDGDADRCLIVDEQGRLIDGDMITYLGALTGQHSHVAMSIMANTGIVKAIEDQGVAVSRTKVGDRFLLEARRQHRGTFKPVTLGAEQSGHVIYFDEPGGDGLQTFARAVDDARSLGVSLGALYDKVQDISYPQELTSVRVVDKNRTMSHPEVQAAYTEIDELISDVGGRTDFRASGTEDKVRFLAEAPQGNAEAVRAAVRRFEAAVTDAGLRAA